MIDLKVKELFFDREKVRRAVDRGRRVALNRIGAFIRLTSRRSMRKRKGASPVGTPPHSHTGLLRQHLYYSYDPSSESVVIGPALLSVKNPGAVPIDATVPQVLEVGGQVLFKRRRGGAKVVTVRPRPYMGPALEQAEQADKLSKAWKEVVR